MTQPSSLWATRLRVWTWPIVMAVLTLFGLLASLLGAEGPWWWASWIALSIPLLAALRFWLLRRFFKRKSVQ